MAAKPFSKEQLNFFKFSTLVLDEFPKVLRQLFIIMWDSKVSMKPGFIPWDDSITVRNLLLTSEGGKTDIPTGKSIEEWDCTALFKATIYAKTFGAPSSKGSTLNDLYLKRVKPAPGCFHCSVQSSTGNQDETYALAIDQLRLLRNQLCHSPKPEIVKNDFDVYVQLIINALTAMKIDTSFVDVISQMSEDDFPTEKVQKLEESRIKELQAISMFHEKFEQKMEDIEQKLSSIDKRTENIEQMMKNAAEPSKSSQSLASLFERKRRDKDICVGYPASSVFLESEGRKSPTFIRPKSSPISEHSKERLFGINRSNSSPMFLRQIKGAFLRDQPVNVMLGLDALLSPKRANNWRAVARELGMPRLQIRNIEASDNYQPAEKMLSYWATRNDATLDKLYQALRKRGRDDACTFLEENVFIHHY